MTKTAEFTTTHLVTTSGNRLVWQGIAVADDGTIRYADRYFGFNDYDRAEDYVRSTFPGARFFDDDYDFWAAVSAAHEARLSPEERRKLENDRYLDAMEAAENYRVGIA